MSMLDVWSDETIETAIRLLVCAERLLEPFRDQEGDWGGVHEQITRFLKEEC
jgi:hypothetical protein